MLYHRDGSLPNHDQIFVFGSNLAGVHGAGAAKQALKYGARMGHGVGLQGMSYAIPTKDHNIKTLPLNIIGPHIEQFKQFTSQYTTANFFVTRVGCGLAGYGDADIAPLFRGCGENCSFPEQWEAYLKEQLWHR